MKHSTNERKRKRKEGFTLIELMVVIIILGLLVGLVGPRVIEQFRRGKRRIACIDIQNIIRAIENFQIDHNRLPDDLDEMWNPTDENATVYLGQEPIDPWGFPYLFTPESGSSYELKSLGADGQEGGDGENADISKEEALKEFRKKRTE